jgi:isopropylmalate/homocitrate/citramalate synthase
MINPMAREVQVVASPYTRRRHGGAPISEERLVHNYLVEAGFAARLPKGLQIWEETLRDGEQTPGVAYTPEEKLQIARLLDEIRVPIMDVGIPVVSREEARAVRAIANAGLDATVMAAARTVRKDVEACIDCGVDEIALFTAGSDLHIRHKLGMTREQVKEVAVRETEYAIAHGVAVSFVTEDTFRADLDFVVDLYNACTEAGAHRAVVCDTVGVMTPPGIRWFFGALKGRLAPTELSFHGHNDFGLAVANSLAAIEEGVRVPHTCVNGLGERAGNASFEELVLALEALYAYDTGIEVSRLYDLSQLVERLSGIPVGVSKPLVGPNAFAHESGIHAHGVIKHTATYEPIQPERIGRKRTFVFGKHTGSQAVAEKLRSHGTEATPDQVLRLVALIKDFAEGRSKEDQQAFVASFRERVERFRGVTDDEFWALAAKAGIAPKGRRS